MPSETSELVQSPRKFEYGNSSFLYNKKEGMVNACTVILATITHYFDCPLLSLSERSIFDLPI